MTDLDTSALADHADLLLRETNHRCANDLQLVVSLLALQGRQAVHSEARAVLMDATARVAVLARARAGLSRQDRPDLSTALREVCEALHSQAEPRGILLSVAIEQDSYGLASNEVTTLTLAVNELATNAIKHAFREEGGRITIALCRGYHGAIVVTVDDDGLPLPDGAAGGTGGMGFGLVRRLIASIGGTFDCPTGEAKCFRITVPRQPA